MEGVFTLVQATAYGKIEGLRADYEREEKLANELLEIAPENVDETVRRVLNGSS